MSPSKVDEAPRPTSDEENLAAIDQPDVRPMTDGDFARMRWTPRVKIIRRALRRS